MSKRISRATMLKGMGALAVAALTGELYTTWPSRASTIPCRMLGPSSSLGHRVRDGMFNNLPDNLIPTRRGVTIVGGGIAGLSAAWWLKRNGYSDFVLLEMENQVGGNSASSTNNVSAFPWGAHYVPLANKESLYVRMLFEELGVIEGYDDKGLPVYNPLYLCHEPQERLLKDGSFQEGMIPHRGLQPADKEQMERFFEIVHNWKSAIGGDKKPAFAIPVDLSSQDSELLALDQISMSDWLKRNGFNSRPLLWYVNYCCRDDYGSTIDHVSAWAGIHYFAARNGVASNAGTSPVVTWPEGNGFLVNQLKQRLDGHIVKGAMAARITPVDNCVVTHYMETKTNKHLTLESDAVIFAAPRFIAGHIIADYEFPDSSHLAYTPWMVANITVKDVPHRGGVPLCWDNMNYMSNSLGYVVATHQNIVTRLGPTVITYYYPLSDADPAAARRRLLSMPAAAWSGLIVDDLEKMHPGITDDITSIDLWPWGHGMIRPSVNFLWGDTRRKMKEVSGNIFFAHSDMSGMSNFEEAQYHGVEAAKSVLSKHGGKHGLSSI